MLNIKKFNIKLTFSFLFFFFHNFIVFNYIFKFYSFNYLLILKIKKNYATIKIKYKLNLLDIKNKTTYFDTINNLSVFKKNTFFLYNVIYKKKKTKLLEINKNYLLNLKNRNILKNSFYIKKFRSKKITKKILNLNKNLNYYFLNKLTFSLWYILLLNHFVIVKQDIFFFLKNKFVFINRIPQKNPEKKLKKGDIIELIYFKNYFIYLFKIQKLLMFKHNFYLKYKQKWLDWNQNNKKIKFLLECKNYSYFIIKNLEIDFIGLSIIIINEKVNFFYLDWRIKNLLLFFYFSLYNWKYIN